MTGQEISRVETHFNSLDNKLSSGLREGVRAESSVEPDTLQVSTSLVEERKGYIQSTRLGWSRRA